MEISWTGSVKTKKRMMQFSRWARNLRREKKKKQLNFNVGGENKVKTKENMNENEKNEEIQKWIVWQHDKKKRHKNCRIKTDVATNHDVHMNKEKILKTKRQKWDENIYRKHVKK